VLVVVAVTTAAAAGDAPEFSGVIIAADKTHQYLLALEYLTGSGRQGQQERIQRGGGYREPCHAMRLH
jgi:hypothetical protein